MAKTFTNLTELNIGSGPGQIQIVRCSEVLSNHMQCWRAGDVLVTVTGEVFIDENGVVTQKVVQYQKCRAHANFESDADAKAVKAAEVEANNALASASDKKFACAR